MGKSAMSNNDAPDIKGDLESTEQHRQLYAEVQEAIAQADRGKLRALDTEATIAEGLIRLAQLSKDNRRHEERRH